MKYSLDSLFFSCSDREYQGEGRGEERRGEEGRGGEGRGGGSLTTAGGCGGGDCGDSGSISYINIVEMTLHTSRSEGVHESLELAFVRVS